MIASGSEPVWATCPHRSGFGVRVATWVTRIGQPARAVINAAFCSSNASVPPPTVPRPQMPTDKISVFSPLKIVLVYCALYPDHRLIFSSLKRAVRNVIRHCFPVLNREIDGVSSVLSEPAPAHLSRTGVFSSDRAWRPVFHCPYTRGPGDHQKRPAQAYR